MNAYALPSVFTWVKIYKEVDEEAFEGSYKIVAVRARETWKDNWKLVTPTLKKPRD